MTSDGYAAGKIDLKKGIGFSLAVFLTLLAITWTASKLKIDLKVAAYFFSDQYGWFHKNTQPFKALYLYGTMPGLGLTLGSLAFYSLGFIKEKWQSYQRPMLVIVLTSVLGAGLLVNAILKPYCGRPRPREITPFNGQWEYCSPCFNETPGKGLSFPCGHCTMGFLFVTLIYLRRKAPAVAYGGTAFGLFYGSLLGLARAAQGAHFVTDTLWSLGVLVIVSLLLYYILIPLMESSRLRPRTLSKRQIVAVGIAVATAMILITTTFLTRRPFYEMTSYQLDLPSEVRQVVVYSDVAVANNSVEYKDAPARVALIGRGFGWHKAKEKVKIVSEVEDRRLNINVSATRSGYFAELQHQLLLTLPLRLKGRIDVELISSEEKK